MWNTMFEYNFLSRAHFFCKCLCSFRYFAKEHRQFPFTEIMPLKTFPNLGILLSSRTFFILLFDKQYVSLKMPFSYLLNIWPKWSLFPTSGSVCTMPMSSYTFCQMFSSINPLLFMNIPLLVILISVSSLASYYLDLLLLSSHDFLFWSSLSPNHPFLGHLNHFNSTSPSLSS